jgi:precorrin-6B methylase 2
MSVAALAPLAGWTVADACAAPGNKTTQAASYVGQAGTVLACERDPRRFEILQAMRLAACFQPLRISELPSNFQPRCLHTLAFVLLIRALSPASSGNYR